MTLQPWSSMFSAQVIQHFKSCFIMLCLNLWHIFPVWTQLQEAGSALSVTNMTKERRLQKLFTQSLKTRLNLRGDAAIASSTD